MPDAGPRPLDGRGHALALLAEVERGRRLDVVWEARAPRIPPEARGWVHEAVFGLLRLRGRVDHLLALHLHRGLDSVPPPLLRVLRLAVYQLLQMGSVPDHAAVSEAVSEARRIGGRGAAGLVNGVLRSLLRGGTGADRFPQLVEDPVAHLATWGSHPRWLVSRWVAVHGPEGARAIVEAGNRIPSIHLRPLTISVEEAHTRLLAAGIGSRVDPEERGTLQLERGVDPAAALAAVPGTIQDPAAAAVVRFVAPRPGDRVADLCAAPGGKGIGLAGLGATVLAADPSPGRLRRMRTALRRLGLPERLVVARGEAPPFAPVDVVLVDAPCTGTGTLARHPDARWRLGPDDPARLAEVQARILRGAATVVRPGGLLVYATCTLEAEENDEMVRRFLDEHPAFALDGPEAVLRILPGEDRTDGAFAARLRRTA